MSSTLIWRMKGAWLQILAVNLIGHLMVTIFSAFIGNLPPGCEASLQAVAKLMGAIPKVGCGTYGRDGAYRLEACRYVQNVT